MAITYETTLGALNKEDKALAQLIIPREGFSSSVYSDVDRQGTETGLAAGFGHRLTDEDLKQYKVGDEIRHKQALDWLKGDLVSTREASQKQASEIPNATEDFQKALQKVNFQLGPGWTQKFPTAWEHMKAGRWDQAIEEIKFTKEGSGQASKWSQQTPERVEDFTQAIQAQGVASQVPSSPEYTEPMEKHWSEPDEEITLDQNITTYHENPDILKEEIVRKFKPKPLTGVAEQRLNNFKTNLPVIDRDLINVMSTIPVSIWDEATEAREFLNDAFSDFFGNRFENIEKNFKPDTPVEQAIQSIVPNVAIEEGIQELDKMQQEFTDARENEARQESEAKVLAKRKEYKESSKERESASEERMKKNLVEQAKKANVEKEVAQLDKTTEKAMSKELWLGKSRVAKQGYFSLFAGGPKVSKKVYDEHLKGVINSYIEQVKKREEKSSTGLGDTKKYPDKKLLERLQDLGNQEKLSSIQKKEMATIKQEIKNRNRTPSTYRRGYKLKPLPLG